MTRRTCETTPNLNAQHYLMRATLRSRRIVLDGLHGHRKLIKNTASYVCTPNTNGGLVFNDEATGREASGRQHSVGSTGIRKGNQTLPPQGGVTGDGSQHLCSFDTLCKAAKITRTWSNTSTTGRSNSFPLSSGVALLMQPFSTSAVPASILSAHKRRW